MNVVNVGYRSVNCYAVETGAGYLLIDVGMPGTYGEFSVALRSKSVPLAEIRLLVVTHFHPDHCGIAQKVKEAGVVLLLGDVQAPRLAEANRWLAKFPGYAPISPDGNVIVPAGSRAAWKSATGVGGVLLHTPGHSDDSVSVVVDGLGAFVGDLRPPEAYAGEAARSAAESWEKIGAAGARTVYPAHGPVFGI
ncbi:MAG: MBL fold metallo-hydrolase [Candidatus Bipolaricaulis sp.]|nr:MBL fold metallo-hydrolase [Candidatus Bipolaricaulis sp.]